MVRCTVTDSCSELIKGRIIPSPLETHSIEYKVPLKSGKVRNYFALYLWIDLIGDIDLKKQFKESEDLEWQDKVKIENTKKFIIFIKEAMKNG